MGATNNICKMQDKIIRASNFNSLDPNYYKQIYLLMSERSKIAKKILRNVDLDINALLMKDFEWYNERLKLMLSI